MNNPLHQCNTAFKLKPLTIALCGALSLGVVHAQETITYTGDGAGLQTIASTGNSVGPNQLATPLSLSGNTVSINYDPTAGNPMHVGRAVGAYSTGDSDSLFNNVVTLENGKTTAAVMGAFNKSTGTLFNNTANVIAGTVNAAVYGGYSSKGNTTSNDANISGGSVTGNIAGGSSYNSGDVTSNYVNIRGSAAAGAAVFGGMSYNGAGKVIDNKATLGDTATVAGNLYGGYGKLGLVSKNSATMTGGTVSTNVFGGGSVSGNVEQNAVTISNGQVTQSVFGGSSDTGSVSENIATLSGGTVNQSVHGGHSSDTGVVSKNTVEITGAATVSKDIHGGYSENALATGNQVTISHSGAQIGRTVHGGFSKAGNVESNQVFLSVGNVAVNIQGGLSTSGKAQLNTVSMSGGTVQQNVFGGSSTTGSVSENIATLSGGNVNASVHGGYSSDAGVVSKNTANIAGTATVSNHVHGGYSVNGDATGNKANISGGTVNQSVHGGYSENANATGNIVTVSGGKIDMHVIGGYVNTAGNATGNTVVITGAPTFNTNTTTGTALYGGANAGGAGGIRTGNTLQMRTTDVAVRTIANFENLHFYLPNTVTNGATVLTLTDANGANISGSNVGVGIAGGSSVLNAGDSVTLIRTTGGNLTTDANNLVNKATGMQGISTLYEFELSTQTNNQLLARVASAKANPQTKSLSEGRLAGLAFVNQGADMASGTGMERALAAVQAGNNGFAAISGGNNRYKSGSHVDVKGVNLLAGAATNLPNASGNLMLGGFFEAGWGNYDSFNSFTNGNVKASGDNRYYGAGVLARQDFASKLYVEGSARVGKLENDYASSDLADSLGNTASYKLNKVYYGLHLGVGYQMQAGTGELDMYGKYLFTQQKGGSALIAGDSYSFKNINSQRSRLGAMYKHPINTNATFKLGAAWEHEFDGKAKASVHGVSLATPEIKGSTAVLEAGISYKPQANSKLSLEAGIQGYAGKRQGVTGNVAVKYAF